MEEIGLDTAANETNKKQRSVSRLRCCVIVLLILGLFLTIIACFIPTLLNNYIVSEAQRVSVLTPENAETQFGIPGANNLTYNLEYYVYNCTNV